MEKGWASPWYVIEGGRTVLPFSASPIYPCQTFSKAGGEIH